ncbi:hypothetical protein MTO96_029810 [Rhipicephalus appendiculatus]
MLIRRSSPPGACSLACGNLSSTNCWRRLAHRMLTRDHGQGFLEIYRTLSTPRWFVNGESVRGESATFRGSCVPFLWSCLPSGFDLQAWSSMTVTSEKTVPRSPVDVAVGIVPGRPYWKAQRKVAAMFLRGSVHVPEPPLHISLQLSSAFAPGVPSSVHAHRIFLWVPKVFPVDILSALLRVRNLSYLGQFKNRYCFIGPDGTNPDIPDIPDTPTPIGMCDPPPGILCPGKVAPTGVDKSLVVFDQSDHSCRSYRHGPNCLVGDNRFRDMVSCRAACTGPQPQPACSAPVHFRFCIPGVDTSSSLYYNYAEYCLEVTNGSCLRGAGFGSRKDCEDKCKGESTDAAQCHDNDVRLCTIPEQLYQIAFIGGRCEQRVNICPTSVGFTSISHCVKIENQYPWWAGSCDLFDMSDAKDSTSTTANKFLNSLARTSLSAGEYADDVRRRFVKAVFSDSEFEESVAHYRQLWMPEIPTDQLEQSTTPEEAYRTVFHAAYNCLQYYELAMEQAVLGQIRFRKPFRDIFNEVHQGMIQLLCKVLFGMERFRVELGPEVERNAMPEELKNLERAGERNLRDYLTLRDYTRLAQRLSELFTHLRDRY